MVKLVDMPDLGSGAARRVGSSPIIRTEKKLLRNQKLFCFLMYFLFLNPYKNSFAKTHFIKNKKSKIF